MIRQSLGVGPNCVVIVSSGRAHPYKRFDFIVRAAAAMRGATDRDFVFFLIGDGHAIPELKAQIEALELNERVHLLGFRSDVRDILSAADISIHASLGEGFSLSIVEYMSAGLPVVVPDIPSVSQAIERGISGLIYARDSIEQAAECVLTLCSDVSMRTEMGKAAKKRADSLYTSDRTINEFRLALQSLLTSTPT